VYGGPMSSDSMLKRAIADFDSALVFAADSPRISNFARVSKGRALLDLARYSEAAAAVAAVPTSYVFNAELTTAVAGQSNTIWSNMNSGGITVSDREGRNGLNFQSANDARVPTQFIRVGTDGQTRAYLFSRFTGLGSPIAMASGLEARLIQAEAALQANRNDANPTGSGWLGILNNLRATAITPALPALTDPGSFNARVDLLFRERAFWMYATGHRMGDLRRLLKHYGRTQEQTYPVGAYKAGQNYMNDVVFILTLSEQSNPSGRTCTDKNP
jgi:starch-binding outer membrane protein, SusD/RagB family